MANIYNKVPVKVQKKSGFDKSFQNLFTSKVGTITPIMVDEVIPNSTVNLRVAMSAALPPLASDTFMRCKLKYAAFFVPTRILLPAGSYEKWLTGDDDYSTPYTEQQGTSTGKIVMPVLQLHSTTNLPSGQRVVAPGTLSDYLGVKFTSSATTGSTGWTMDVSALPYLGYHRIYNDWFRNSLVQKDIFSRATNNAGQYNACNSLFVTPNNTSAQGYIMSDTVTAATSSWVAQGIGFADGTLLTQLRQANFDIDLFTSSTPQAQNGAAQSVSFSLTDSAGSALTETGFTISALRAANSIQQWLERNNLAGNRMVDYVKANYGANLSDYIAQRPVLLGSGSFDVFSKGIYQTNNVDASDTTSRNPFNMVGSRFGSAFIDGNDLIIKNFTAAEPGYIYVLVWLSPKVTYSTGIDPMLARYTKASTQSQMANPILQNVGNEPIYSWQLCDTVGKVGTPNVSAATIFGYNDRYYAWKDKVDEVHGLLRDGESLKNFALQRTFTNAASANSIQISSNFLQIPTSYLDQVAAVSNYISNYGYWCDTYLDYKVSMPLARYSVPSLQDPAYEHGDDIMIDKSGRQLA